MHGVWWEGGVQRALHIRPTVCRPPFGRPIPSSARSRRGPPNSLHALLALRSNMRRPFIRLALCASAAPKGLIRKARWAMAGRVSKAALAPTRPAHAGGVDNASGQNGSDGPETPADPRQACFGPKASTRQDSQTKFQKHPGGRSIPASKTGVIRFGRTRYRRRPNSYESRKASAAATPLNHAPSIRLPAHQSPATANARTESSRQSCFSGFGASA